MENGLNDFELIKSYMLWRIKTQTGNPNLSLDENSRRALLVRLGCGTPSYEEFLAWVDKNTSLSEPENKEFLRFKKLSKTSELFEQLKK